MINDITMLILATTICAHSYAGSKFTIIEMGNDVHVYAEGTINLSELTFNRDSASKGSLNAQVGRVVAGDGVGRNVTAYKGVLMGPASFGSINSLVLSSSGTGDHFGISASGNEVYVPKGYVSGNTLTGESTYSNQSLAALGLTPGITHTYAWGTGPNADSLTVRIISTETDLSPVGTYNWWVNSKQGPDTIMKSDHTCMNGGRTGTWIVETPNTPVNLRSTVTIHWTGNYTDVLTVSPNGRKLTGANNEGTKINGVLVGTPYTVEGLWDLGVGGVSLKIDPDGTAVLTGPKGESKFPWAVVNVSARTVLFFWRNEDVQDPQRGSYTHYWLTDDEQGLTDYAGGRMFTKVK